MSNSGRLDRFDQMVDASLDHLRGNRLFDRLFYTASTLGDFSVIWYLSAVTRATGGETGRDEAVRLAVCLLVESIFINGLVKSLFRRSRPVHDGPRPHRLRTPRTSSFPSGHATSGFMAATLLADGRPGQIPLWFGLAAIVALSRAYVRIHHASDVVGGAIIGAAMGLLVVTFWPIG